MRDVLAEAAGALERGGLTAWTVGTAAADVRRPAGSVGYPALVDEGDTVALRVLPTEAEQQAAMWAGVRRLLLLVAPSPVKYLRAGWTTEAKLALTRNPHGSLTALLADCSTAARTR